MADKSSSSSDRHRHAHRPAARGRRSRLLLVAVGVFVVSVFAAVLVLSTGDRSGDAAAGRARIGTLLADADYDGEWVHEHIRSYGIRTIIPAERGRPSESTCMTGCS